MDQTAFLLAMRDAAAAVKHPFPEFVACEIAIATDFGTSDLAVNAHNLFALRAPQSLEKGQKTIEVQRSSFVHGRWQQHTETYLQFSSDQECIVYRLKSLQRFNMFAPALRAETGEEFVRELCGQWQRMPDNIQRNSQMSEFGDKVYLFMQPRFYLSSDRAAEIIALHDAQRVIFESPKKEEPKAETAAE